MRRYKSILPVIAGAVVALIMAGCGGGGTHTTTTVIQRGSGTNQPTSFSASGAKGMSINQIYRQASPGVVDLQVISQSTVGGGGGLFGGGGLQQQQQQAEGAGAVYNSSGDIVTDEHVVNGAVPGGITVHFQDGRSAKAKVVGTDPSTDVAVIHVDVPASQLHPIKFADSATAQVGDPVVAIGSPFSQPETVTQGIVSQVGRSIMAPNGYTITGAIQTDAAINPGNSGGPLLDTQGRLVGLADQIRTANGTSQGEGSSSGIGFAVPSNIVAQEANGFIGGNPVKHSYLGICLDSGMGHARVAAHPSQNCPAPVKAGGPGQVAGLLPGDEITAVNGQSIATTEQFITTVANYKPGQKVKLTIKRGGQTQQVTVKLGARPRTGPIAGG